MPCFTFLLIVHFRKIIIRYIKYSSYLTQFNKTLINVYDKDQKKTNKVYLFRHNNVITIKN